MTDAFDHHNAGDRAGLSRFDSQMAWRWNRGVSSQPQLPVLRGKVQQSTLRVSIGVVHNLYRKFTSGDRLFRVLCEVKREAQETPTSSSFVCRCRVNC